MKSGGDARQLEPTKCGVPEGNCSYLEARISRDFAGGLIAASSIPRAAISSAGRAFPTYGCFFPVPRSIAWLLSRI